MNKYFTGVGSRETPTEILALMRNYSRIMTLKGWSFRSGGADGADTAFAQGWCDAYAEDDSVPNGEIYLPWNGFNYLNNRSINCVLVTDKEIIEQAQNFLKDIHPAFSKLTRGSLALHTRNVFQVLGSDLQTPSQGLIGYAALDSKGEPKGGTRTAIKLAEQHGVKVRNLAKEDDLKFIKEFVERSVCQKY